MGRQGLCVCGHMSSRALLQAVNGFKPSQQSLDEVENTDFQETLGAFQLLPLAWLKFLALLLFIFPQSPVEDTLIMHFIPMKFPESLC